jgi:hypothetical protein
MEDTNSDNYSDQELLSLLDLTDLDPLTTDDVIEATTPLIQRFVQEKNTDMASFFQDAQDRLIDSLPSSAPEEYNEQNDPNTTMGDWYQNEYAKQPDENQANKITDRKQQVSFFEQDSNIVMNKNQLGVADTYQVPIAQGQLNPNLKNITERLVNIDSQYRENLLPYTNDANGSTSSTNYTLDLSDPLYKTVSLTLNSYQIPYTWYLIDEQNLSNNCFIVDSSNVSISSGNYNNTTLINEISANTIFNTESMLIISVDDRTLKTTIKNQNSIDLKLTFYSDLGVCNPSCGTSSKINNTLGWILGFRNDTYTISAGQSITSESLIDTFGSKYFLLVLDDFNQNRLNKGIVGITPTLKSAEIPSYWSADLKTSFSGCVYDVSSNPYPVYVQNAPRRLTQAQLYTLNSTIQARSVTIRNRLTSPTTTDVLGYIPLRKNGLSFGQIIIDDFGIDPAERIYFGPVDIERMRVKLVDDKGYTVNLNGADWSFSLIAKSLYQY